MPSVDINWWAVLVAAIVNMVVGAVWYSPALFAKQWSKLVGRKMNEMGDGPTSYVVTAAGAIIQAAILSYLIGAIGVKSVLNGAYVGILVWIGFVAMTQGVNTIFAGTRKKLWAINTGYFLVVLVINGAILAAWR
jgi:hypothetical protein